MKARIFVILLLVVSVILSTSFVWAQDETPPALVSIDLAPTSIDVSTKPAALTVTVHLTDDSSGVASWSTTFSSPSGTQSLEIGASPGLVDGTPTDGTFEGTNALPQGSEEGPWVADILTVTDVDGNTADIDLSAHVLLLLQVGPSLEDLTPPDLVSIEVLPTSVDVTAGDAVATVSAHLTDDLSGVKYFSGTFYSPSGNRYTSFSGHSPISGDRLDGIFEGTALFPQFTEPGVWHPQTCWEEIADPPYYREFLCIHVRDRVGNWAQIDLQAQGITLEVEVVGPPEDVTPPDLVSIEVTPELVNVTAGDAVATVSAHLTDDLSGVKYFSGTFYSPSGNRYTSFSGHSPISGDRLDGIFEGTALFPQFTEPGVWHPQTCWEEIADPPYYREFPCIHVRDRVGNWAQIDLQVGGFPLKLGVVSVPPELIFALVPFSAVNTIGSAHTITATLSQDTLPIQGVEIAFEVIAGPHLGTSGVQLTDENGEATFTYTGTAVGVDTIIASVDIDGDGEIDAARQATKEWEEVTCIEVLVDIKPGSDPNCIKATSKGNIPVAILSESEVDLNDVDVSTVLLDGVAPVRWSLNKDVSGDSVPDLVFHFSTPELNNAGLLVDGDTLSMTGELLDSTPILGSDVIYLAGGPNCFD